MATIISPKDEKNSFLKKRHEMESRRKTLLKAVSKTQGENESKLFQVLKDNYNEDNIFSPTYSSDNRKENSVHINTNSVGGGKVDDLSTSRGSVPFVRHNPWSKRRASKERPSSPILIANQSIKQTHLRSPPYNYSSPFGTS